MDSRLFTKKLPQYQEKGFWGIVWTAGSLQFDDFESLTASFWGIVWTAGIDTGHLRRSITASFWGIVWTAGC